MMEHLSRAQTELNSLLVGFSEDEPDGPSVQDSGDDDASDDASVDLEAMATTGQELVESAEPDAAPAAQPESNQAGDPKPDRAAASAHGGQYQPACSA